MVATFRAFSFHGATDRWNLEAASTFLTRISRRAHRRGERHTTGDVSPARRRRTGSVYGTPQFAGAVGHRQNV